VILQIIEHEKNARQTLLQQRSNTLLDQIGRSYGTLRYAYGMGSKEALNLLSMVKLGMRSGVLSGGEATYCGRTVLWRRSRRISRRVRKKNWQPRSETRSGPAIMPWELESFEAPDVAGVMSRAQAVPGSRRSGNAAEPPVSPDEPAPEMS
jgi:protein arginine kinase